MPNDTEESAPAAAENTEETATPAADQASEAAASGEAATE